MTQASSSDSPATAVVDVQDPLPESNWFWRRVFVFTFSLISIAFVWYGLEALWGLKDADAIYNITRYMIYVHAMIILFYMVAPSAEQITKLVQSAKIIRSGIPMSRTARVEDGVGGKTEVTTSTGVQPVPDAPAEEAPPVAPSADDEQDYAPRSQS